MKPFTFSNGKVTYSPDVKKVIKDVRDLAINEGKDPEIAIDMVISDLISEGKIAAAAVINAAWKQEWK